MDKKTSETGVMTRFQGWAASLNNGETVFESSQAAGEMSAWRQLLKRLKDEPDLQITQLRLQIAGRTIVSKKHAAGYFQGTEFVEEGRMSGNIKTTRKRGIGHVEGDKVIISWVNEQGDIWQDTRPLKEVKIHTTLTDII